MPEQAKSEVARGKPPRLQREGPLFFSLYLLARNCKRLYLVKKEGRSYQVLHEQLDIRREPLRVTSQRLQKYGYDGVELVGEPQRYDNQEVKGLCQEVEQVSIPAYSSGYGKPPYGVSRQELSSLKGWRFSKMNGGQ